MSEVVSVGAIVVFLLLMMYMSVGSCLEHLNCQFGHEASFTVLVGMVISCCCYMTDNEELIRLLKFDDNTFFFICLPPIVFASGFNMQRKNFFANIKNILLFGILGTFVAFFSFSAMTIFMKNKGFMTQYDGKTSQWTQLDLTSPECMLMCSLLCSSDVIAAVSLISYDKQPRLFSIVFGEGIINDAVSIILFNTVMKYTAQNSEITFKTPLHITYDFFQLGFNSLFIGIIFGLMSSYILKQYRSFSKNPVSESMMIFCCGYLSYVCSEVAQNSGIISLLTSGVVMAHYTWYNLSPQGKQSSFIVFQFLGYATEAFVFAYLGLTFFSYTDLKWSPELFAVELVVIVFGRLLGTIGLVRLTQMMGYQAEISLKEQIFIWYAGMIRGAIAFGLVLRIDGREFKNRDVIVTTSLSLVVFTTVVCGSTVGLLSHVLFTDQTESEDYEKVKSKKSLGKDTAINGEDDSFESYDLSNSDSSYEKMLHPNEDPKKHHGKRIYSGCGKYLHRFDELIMKPIFIYKYEKNMQKKSMEFFELFMKQGDEIEHEFTMENANMKQVREDGLQMVQFQPASDRKGQNNSVKKQSQQDGGSVTGYSSISKQFTRTKIRIQKSKQEKRESQMNQKLGDTRGNSNGFTFSGTSLKVPDQSNNDPEQPQNKEKKLRRSSNIQEADHDSDSNNQAPNFGGQEVYMSGGQGETAENKDVQQAEEQKDDVPFEFDDDQEAPNPTVTQS